MTAASELQAPSYPPDLSVLNISRGYNAHLWQPTPGQPGLLVTSGQAHDLPWDESPLNTDMEYAARPIRIPSRMRSLYNYLGVHYDVAADNAVTQSLSFIDSESVNNRLLALDLPESHRPPLTTPWHGDEYPPEEAAEELARNGRFLVATEGRHTVHDAVVHFALAQVLMRPYDTDRLASQAKQALWETSSTLTFMDKLDVLLSSVSIGKTVSKAFWYEQQIAETNDLTQQRAFTSAMERTWQRAGNTYATLLNMETSESRLNDFREHCLMLSDAAHCHAIAD